MNANTRVRLCLRTRLPGLIVGGGAHRWVALHRDGDSEQHAGGQTHVAQPVVDRIESVGHLVEIQLANCTHVAPRTEEKT